MITVTDLFCGAGGSSSGLATLPGVRVVMAANHWTLAIESHQRNHPTTDHSNADISQVEPSWFPTTDILWASPECFTAGHLVTTLYGQVPIEEIVEGDLVMTHTGRFMPVVRTQSRYADTVIVRGQGHPGIETTANHSFWARESGRVWQNDIRQYRREYTVPRWIRADELLRHESLWATPVQWDRAAAPWRPLPRIFGSENNAYLLGRWLGDGSVSEGRNTDVTISCSFEEADNLGGLLEPLGWHRDVKRTAVNFRIGSRDAQQWLIKNCGKGAGGKQLPTWAILWPEEHRRLLLRGYLDADGGMSQRRVRASTVSRKLAVSIRLLAESLGFRVAAAYENRDTYVIEGRSGSARRQWILHWEAELAERRSPEAFVEGIHSWSRVRSVEPGRSGVRVYNIEVADEHSYVLDGIVVKNCTNHSVAKGIKRQRAVNEALFELDGARPLPDEAAIRSRATMWDVPRFAEYHHYKAIIIENVVDAYRWVPFPSWLDAMERLGYEHELVWLNSMHAQARGLPAPQSRDRMYVVFWLKGNRKPDIQKWTRPNAFCERDGIVSAMQVFKKQERWGRYRAQYVYRCPKCAAIVEPTWLPAASAIDWSIPGERIGDKKKPLAEKTRARIQKGIERYWRPLVVTAAGNTYDGINTGSRYLRAYPTDTPLPVQQTTLQHGLAIPPIITDGIHGAGTVQSGDDPMLTQTTAQTKGLAYAPPMMIPVEGREGKNAFPATDPMRTQSTRNETAIVVPLRNHGVAKPATRPIDTVSAEGNHHALVMRNNQGGAEMTTPVTEPMRTLTTAGHQSLLVPYYGASESAKPTSDPHGTLTTTDRYGLIESEISLDVDDVLFRMLTPDEIKVGMAFAADYILLGNKREQVKQAGNAVTPPAARDLGAAVIESLGVELERVG